MADDNRNQPGTLQKAGKLIEEAGRDVARDESSGGKLGSVIRGLSDSRGAEPLWAAVRQGADELGQALKPFPDSIQAHAEPGGMFDPLYHDIVSARDKSAPEQPLPSPSQIGRGEGKAAATVHGPAQQADKAWTPSEISKDRGEKTWADHITQRHDKGNQDGNAGNDQNQQGQGRSQADEQREQDKGRSR